MELRIQKSKQETYRRKRRGSDSVSKTCGAVCFARSKDALSSCGNIAMAEKWKSMNDTGSKSDMMQHMYVNICRKVHQHLSLTLIELLECF